MFCLEQNLLEFRMKVGDARKQSNLEQNEIFLLFIFIDIKKTILLLLINIFIKFLWSRYTRG